MTDPRLEVDAQEIAAEPHLIAVAQGAGLTGRQSLAAHHHGVGDADVANQKAFTGAHHFGLLARDEALGVRQRQRAVVSTANAAAVLVKTSTDGAAQRLIVEGNRQQGEDHG